jgi:hypothetical protein
MGSKKKAAKRWKERKGSEYDQQMKNLTPEQVYSMATQIAEKTGRPIEEVVEAMKTEDGLVIFMNKYMPQVGALSVGDRVRTAKARDRVIYAGGEKYEWPGDQSQEGTVSEVIFRRNGQPVMVRVQPDLDIPTFLFTSKHELEKLDATDDS